MKAKSEEQIALELGLIRAGPEYQGKVVDGWRLSDKRIQVCRLDGNGFRMSLMLHHLISRLEELTASERI